MISLISLGVVLFVSTHVDDLILLLSLFAAHRIAGTSIVLGQYAGVVLLLLGSLLCSEIAVAIPHPYLRWLGLVPFVLGVSKLPALFRPDAETDPSVPPPPVRGNQVWGVTALTVAGGGDNIGVYLPLFATRSRGDSFVIILVFLVMTAIWCVLAHWLAHHRVLRAPIRRWGARFFPVILIALGVKILAGN